MGRSVDMDIFPVVGEDSLSLDGNRCHRTMNVSSQVPYAISTVCRAGQACAKCSMRFESSSFSKVPSPPSVHSLVVTRRLWRLGGRMALRRAAYNTFRTVSGCQVCYRETHRQR
jgi:hypothetical protein